MDWVQVLTVLGVNIALFLLFTTQIRSEFLDLHRNLLPYLIDNSKFKISISTDLKSGNHYCNLTTSNVICFEREGELWVKECASLSSKEARTYMVFYCPWCGFQTGKSKMHEKVNIIR